MNDAPSPSVSRARDLNAVALDGCLDPDAAAPLLTPRPNLLADTRVFLDRSDFERMAEAVAAIDRIVTGPAWRRTLAGADEAGGESGGHRAKGVFFGYDFHLTEAGPKLIEINTNAGGAFINAEALRYQTDPAGLSDPDQVEADFLAMFRREWALAGNDAPLGRVAIVDETPELQYLNPDFELCRRLLANAGIEAAIRDPAALTWDGGCLRLDGKAVDLVYNRLTDFALAQPAQAALRAAWRNGGATVLTPHPLAHALFADKHNLERLSDRDFLGSLEIPSVDRELLLAVVPATERVRADQGDDLWARRKGLFFKPAGGYGGKAVYRGMNVTKRVFAEILAGDYVAQELAPPPSRTVRVGGAAVDLKYDLRCYAYEGRVQLTVARLWQGQTTNFRTPGGGFAPVAVV